MAVQFASEWAASIRSMRFKLAYRSSHVDRRTAAIASMRSATRYSVAQGRETGGFVARRGCIYIYLFPLYRPHFHGGAIIERIFLCVTHHQLNVMLPTELSMRIHR